MVNAFDQIREAFGAAVIGFGPVPQPETWIDWSVVGTLVTAFATVALVAATWVLFCETKRMRKTSDRNHDWNVRTYKESQEPRFIIYTELDEVENRVSIVFQNVTDNPAYNVSLRFVPDLELKVFKPGRGKNPHLSTVGFYPYAVVAPRQRIVREYGVLTNETGDFLDPNDFKDVDVRVTYEGHDGIEKSAILRLDTYHNCRTWYEKKNTLIALQKQIKESVGELSKTVLVATEPRRAPPSPRPARSVVQAATAARIPRPTRDILSARKRRRP